VNVRGLALESLFPCDRDDRCRCDDDTYRDRDTGIFIAGDRSNLEIMNWVDVLIVAVVIVAAIRGWFQGAIRQVLGWIGLIAGFYVGIAIAPSLSTTITHSTWRPVLALVIVVVAAYAGHFLGHLVGATIRRTVKMVKMGLLDSAAGMVIAVAGALVTVWLVAALLVSTSWSGAASGIQGSRIIKSLDQSLPTVPSAEARLQTLLRNANFPNVFASIVSPTVPSSGSVPTLGSNTVSPLDPVQVQKVLATGCPDTHEGSGFFVAMNLLVTNAHVVAGATSVTVGGVAAKVALFDLVNDIAVLRVAMDPAPLSFVGSTPSSGTKAEVIGFPLNGRRTISPSIINGEITAKSRDIYDKTTFARTVLVVYSNIEPGNSGSPVLVKGRVAGVVFSKSLSQSETAYAIPAATVERDLAQTSTNGIQSTQSCVN
jgi:S1-C subfamily serine protease